MEQPTPLFVFGVARSGTSYLYYMLRSHPAIRLTYEGLIVKEADYYYAKHKDPRTREQFEELLDNLSAIESEQTENRWLVDIMNNRRDSLWERYRKNPGFSQFIESIYLDESDAEAWGNKMLRLEVCPDIIKRWPNCKIVILLRDPRAVYLSQSRTFRHQLRYSSIYWNLHSALTRLNGQDANRFLVVKYEDLVAEPFDTLSKIFAHAGVESQESTRSILEEHPVSSSGLDKWKSVMTDEQVKLLESLCFDEMKQSGYEPKFATEQREQGRWQRAFIVLRQYAGKVPLNISWWRRKNILKRFMEAVSARSF